MIPLRCPLPLEHINKHLDGQCAGKECSHPDEPLEISNALPFPHHEEGDSSDFTAYDYELEECPVVVVEPYDHVFLFVLSFVGRALH